MKSADTTQDPKIYPDPQVSGSAPAQPSSSSSNATAPPPSYSPGYQPTPTMVNNTEGSSKGQWLLRRPASTQSRLIIDLYPDCFWGKPQVLADEVLQRVPPVLEAKGVSQEEWVKWMNRLKTEVQGSTLSCFAGTLLVFSMLGIPYLYGSCISRQVKMKKFNQEINEQLFEPLGLYWKTQTSSISIDDYHEDVAWIAIALDKEESERLKKEENVFYFIPCFPQHQTCGCWTRYTECMCCCCQRIQF